MLYNVREYHRPTSIEEAAKLLSRKNVRTVPLGGGTSLVGETRGDIEAVVDLCELGLETIEREDRMLRVGAMVRLQTIVETLGDVASGMLADTAHRMAPWNVRNSATVGGALASRKIHEPLSVALAALRARVEIHGRKGEPPVWSDLANEIREPGLPAGQVITGVTIPLPAGELGGGYDHVGRTPRDLPIVCAAAVAYAAGDGTIETYTAVGGLLHDLLAIGEMIRADDAPGGIEAVAGKVVREHAPDDAYLSDFLGTPEYRRGVAPVVARRALSKALAAVGVAAS